MHSSKNTMNDMILANVKQANDASNAGSASNAVLGKRPRSDAGGNDDINAEADSMPQKKRKK